MTGASAATLRACLAQASSALAQGAGATDRRVLRLLDEACLTARVLQRVWAEPPHAAAAALQRAEAAVARSCAHLRCANLEGFASGPAAGKGRGCKRCGACRVAW